MTEITKEKIERLLKKYFGLTGEELKNGEDKYTFDKLYFYDKSDLVYIIYYILVQKINDKIEMKFYFPKNYKKMGIYYLGGLVRYHIGIDIDEDNPDETTNEDLVFIVREK